MDNMNRVIQVLKKEPLGCTISELSEKLNVTRNTVALSLAELKGAQKIEIRQVGMAKLHIWRGK